MSVTLNAATSSSLSPTLSFCIVKLMRHGEMGDSLLRRAGDLTYWFFPIWIDITEATRPSGFASHVAYSDPSDCWSQSSLQALLKRVCNVNTAFLDSALMPPHTPTKD